jgi:hypothetical protein
MKPKTVQAKVPPPKVDPKNDLKTLPMPEVEKRLTATTDGLTQAEVAKRLTQYGPNEITEKKTNPLLKFLSYFWGPLPWMIEAAVIPSGVVRQGISSRSRARPNHDVSEAVRRRTFDDIPDPHARPFLVYTPREDIVDGCSGYANHRDTVCGLRLFDDSSGLAMGAVLVGLRPSLVSGE